MFIGDGSSTNAGTSTTPSTNHAGTNNAVSGTKSTIALVTNTPTSRNVSTSDIRTETKVFYNYGGRFSANPHPVTTPPHRIIAHRPPRLFAPMPPTSRIPLPTGRVNRSPPTASAWHPQVKAGNHYYDKDRKPKQV